MVDITRDEFWEEEKEKTILKNKFLSISMFIFGICIMANVALMYSFFKIILTV